MSSAPLPTLPATFKRVEVHEAKGEFKIVDVPMYDVGPDEILVRVEACGVCHSDVYCKEGLRPDVVYPRVPGHEVAGVVVRVGSSVKEFTVGDHVGRGWHGGHGGCGGCGGCKSGRFPRCPNFRVTGLTVDGGYTQYMKCSGESLCKLPAELPLTEAAPLMCAGITVFNALRHCGAIAPALVAVQGIGGLGHLAIQFARRLGFQVAAVSTGDDKRELSLRLGAHFYVNSTKDDAVAEIKKLGGARVLVATAFDSDAVTHLTPCLGYDGVVLQLGSDQKSVHLSARQFIGQRNRYQGWPSGTAADSQDTALFASYTGVKPMVETFPLDKVQEAYDRMMTNKARFRSVLLPQTLST